MLLVVAYFEASLQLSLNLCQFTRYTLEFGDINSFLSFFKKMPIQRFSPY